MVILDRKNVCDTEQKHHQCMVAAPVNVGVEFLWEVRKVYAQETCFPHKTAQISTTQNSFFSPIDQSNWVYEHQQLTINYQPV